MEGSLRQPGTTSEVINKGEVPLLTVLFPQNLHFHQHLWIHQNILPSILIVFADITKLSVTSTLVKFNAFHVEYYDFVRTHPFFFGTV